MDQVINYNSSYSTTKTTLYMYMYAYMYAFSVSSPGRTNSTIKLVYVPHNKCKAKGRSIIYYINHLMNQKNTSVCFNINIRTKNFTALDSTLQIFSVYITYFILTILEFNCIAQTM